MSAACPCGRDVSVGDRDVTGGGLSWGSLTAQPDRGMWVLERRRSEDVDAAVFLGALRDSGKVHDACGSLEGLAGAAVEGLALARWLDA